MNIYHDEDADLEPLQGKKIAVIGYGSQGHAHALNLRDSGCDVRVGLRPRQRVAQEGRGARACAWSTPATAAREADVVMMLVPDELGARDLRARDRARPDGRASTWPSATASTSTSRRSCRPPSVNVFMVAPKGPGHLVRSEYQKGRGVPCLLAIQQDPSGDTQAGRRSPTRKAHRRHARGVLETTFKEETETDLFGEQAVLCGGLTELIRAGYETLVEAGYSPEMAYFECLHEVKLIVDLIYEGGIANMRYSISNTAEYGDMTRGKRVIGQETREAMKKILADIQSRQVRRRVDDRVPLRPAALPRAAQGSGEAPDRGGRRASCAALMPWLGSNRLVDRVAQLGVGSRA